MPSHRISEDLHLIGGHDPTPLLRRLRDSLTEGWPRQWWLLPPDKIAELVRAVEVKGKREVLLPIDALPLGDFERPLASIVDRTDLLSLMSLFGGYCCVVRYVSYGKDREDENGDSLTAGPRVLMRSMLPPAPTTDPAAVAYLRSKTAEYHDLMYDYLVGNKWRVLGPFPARGELKDGESIAQFLLSSGLLPLPDSGEYVLPGIAHVHAHATSERGFSRELVVQFSDESGTVELTSGSVEEAMRILEKERMRILEEPGGSPPDSCGPLVVFSACGALSGLGSPLVSTAFNMAETGCRAVIGPRDAIPASVAYAFSRDLFKGLGQHGEVGRVTVGCRWHLMQSENNPLGILYSVFGNTAKLPPEG